MLPFYGDGGDAKTITITKRKKNTTGRLKTGRGREENTVPVHARTVRWSNEIVDRVASYLPYPFGRSVSVAGTGSVPETRGDRTRETVWSNATMTATTTTPFFCVYTYYLAAAINDTNRFGTRSYRERCTRNGLSDPVVNLVPETFSVRSGVL